MAAYSDWEGYSAKVINATGFIFLKQKTIYKHLFFKRCVKIWLPHSYFQKLTTTNGIFKLSDFKVQKDFKAVKLADHAGEQGQMIM